MGIRNRQCQNQHRWEHKHTRQGNQRSTPAKMFSADHDAKIERWRTWHRTGNRPFLNKLLARHPFLFIDKLTLNKGKDTTKPLDREHAKRIK